MPSTVPCRVYVITLIASLCRIAVGYSNRAPHEACCSLMPSHGPSPQTSQSPFYINVSQTSYTAGDRITVTLNSPPNRKIEGFLLQARRADPSKETVSLIGTFKLNDTSLTQYGLCGTNSASDIGSLSEKSCTHSSPVGKSIVSFTWVAPPAPEGHIVFRCTFVEHKPTFWVAVNSPIVRDASLGGGPLTFTDEDVANRDPCNRTVTRPRQQNTTSVVTSPSLVTRAATTPRGMNTTLHGDTTPRGRENTTLHGGTTPRGVRTPLTRNADCYVTRGCFDDCDDTGKNCTTTFSWKKDGDYIEYMLGALVPDTDYWTGVGFSSDQLMSHTAVLECVKFNRSLGAFSSYNVGYKNFRNAQTFTSKNPPAISYNGGVLSCILRLKPKGDLYHEPWYLMLAHGPANANGTLRKHAVVHISSTTAKLSSDIRKRLYIEGSVGATSSTLGQVNVTSSRPSVVNTTQQSTEKARTVTMESNTLVRDAQCNITKGCLDDCGDGDACTILASWVYKGDNSLTVELAALKPKPGNFWMAIGMSSNNKMGDTSVVECVSFTNKVEAFTSYNYGYSNARTDKGNDVQLVTSSMQDGVFRCTIDIWHHNTSKSGVVDLEQAWHVMLAHGPAKSDGAISYHTEAPVVSLQPIYLTDMTSTPIEYRSTMPSREKLTRHSECETKRGCMDDCGDDGSCTILASWIYKSANSITIELLSRPTADDYWMAVGFSKTPEMGDTSVAECVRFEDDVAVYTSYNEGQRNERTDPADGVLYVAASSQGEVFQCIVEIVPHNRSRSRMVDLEQKWHVILAHGPANSDGSIKKHVAAPIVSQERISLNVTGVKEGEPKSNYIAKIHACLMLAAWIFTSTVGMYISRYYKNVWASSNEMCGKNVWFVVHVMLMVLTLALTIAAFVIIFVDVGGYSSIGAESRLVGAHPILGIIVTVLVIINPIMSLFRCDPSSDHRKIFNWMHRLVGMSAWILAQAAIFSAFHIDHMAVEVNAVYIWYGYIAYQILGAFIQEILGCQARQHKSSQYTFCNESGGVSKTVDSTIWCGTTRTVMVVTHTLIEAAFFTAFVIMVLRAGHDGVPVAVI